tara:strand:- start:6845 stop:7048 length:204 start_codon:yes stop_codon:yes gene_type:complete
MSRIKNSTQLTKELAIVINKVKKGKIAPVSAKIIINAADKINNNELNAIAYKKLAENQRTIEFFENE